MAGAFDNRRMCEVNMFTVHGCRFTVYGFFNELCND